ncbi:MAG: hypothetical protein EON89_04785 [Brevundimonas sp.]|nr:MAG: hypothetical protein EON89_04785 [Brevundimonas sp.]
MAADDTAGESVMPGAKDAWRLWAELKARFPAWSLIPSSFYTPGAFGYLGVDFISGFRRNPSTIAAFGILEGVDDATFDAVSALASLNARRQDQMFRAVVIGYLTVPISVLALLAELAGGSMVSFARQYADFIIPLAVGFAAAPLSYGMSHWRSRQILGVLDLIRIERGQAPFTALELREE